MIERRIFTILDNVPMRDDLNPVVVAIKRFLSDENVISSCLYEQLTPAGSLAEIYETRGKRLACRGRHPLGFDQSVTRLRATDGHVRIGMIETASHCIVVFLSSNEDRLVGVVVFDRG